jgi:hypothetical protein
MKPLRAFHVALPRELAAPPGSATPTVATARVPRRALLGRAFGGCGLLLLVSACLSSRGGEVDPRYIAVHNTLSSLGMAQTGPIHRGSLAEGREARFRVDLPAQCTTLVAFGSAGFTNLDMTLEGEGGQKLAQDTSTGPEATVRACVDGKGPYTLVVRAQRGSGEFVAAAWNGGLSAEPGAQTAASREVQGRGTCDAPFLLDSQAVTGSTSRGERDHRGSCGSTDGHEVIYKLEVPQRQRVVLDLDSRFDGVLYVRRDDCAEDGSEVACNDDAPNGRGSSTQNSRIDEVFEPGTYYVFVDASGSEGGTFHLKVQMQEVPTIAEACAKARPLTASGPITERLSGGFSLAAAQCGDEAKGAERAYRVEVQNRSRVRITHRSDEFGPVVHVRRTCVDDKTEVGCSNSGAADEEATFLGVLDPGTYTVFADAAEKGVSGAYTLSMEAQPEAGTGTTGDSCVDAVPLTDPSTEGDTFEAKDDVQPSCAGAAAPDLVYRLSVPKRMRFHASLASQDGPHVISVTRGCNDKSQELACGESVSQVLTPGNYFVVVDGPKPDAFGKFTLNWTLQDVAPVEGACRDAPALAPGKTVSGTTVSSQHRFSLSCLGREDTQTSPDRVYKLVVDKAERVSLTLNTGSEWDGALSVRRACIDNPTAPRAGEVACSAGRHGRGATYEGSLDRGTYFVVVAGRRAGEQGAFTLEYKLLR